MVTRDSPESIADEVLSTLPEGTRFYVLFPASAGLSDPQDKQTAGKRRTASPRQSIIAHLMSLMQRGFTRLFFNGQTIDLQSPDDYPRDDFKDVFVLVDRLTGADVRQRLVDSLEICFQEGHGTAVIETADDRQRLWFRNVRMQVRPHGLRDARTATVQFQQPVRRVSTCQGFGNTIGLDLDLVIPIRVCH